MRKFTFNNPGYPVPSEGVEVELEDLQQLAFTTAREKLLNHYLWWHNSFSNKVTSRFTQWINGSFVTTKDKPQDIDFVTFIDHKVFYAKERFLDRYWSFNLEKEGLDSYLVPIFPQSHKNYELYLLDSVNWYNRYTKSKSGFEKGFLIITSK